MEVGYTVIGEKSGHEAGRALLKEMYEARYGAPMPEIAVTGQGKPYFPGAPVYFSISHTKKHAFCVLSDKPVGIDAEEADRDIRPELADKILSPSEKARYDNKKETLLRFWVLKEAAAKCSGQGLQGYPNHTDFTPDDPRISVIDGCFVAVIENC